MEKINNSELQQLLIKIKENPIENITEKILESFYIKSLQDIPKNKLRHIIDKLEKIKQHYSCSKDGCKNNLFEPKISLEEAIKKYPIPKKFLIKNN